MVIRIYCKIKKLRLEREMTQSDLARLIGISRQSIISLESGKYNPSLPLALQLAKIFDTAVEDIFDLIEEDASLAAINPDEITCLIPFEEKRIG